MDEEELATPSHPATPSHAVKAQRKVKRERTAEERKQRNFSKRKNIQKRLKNAETSVPALSIGVRTAEEQNIALSAALQERDLRIDLLTQRLEVTAGKCAAAEQAKREAEQAVRDTLSALFFSEARSLALKGELATASDKISSLDNDVAQLSFALTIANASAASREVLCSHVAADAVSFATEVLRTQEADYPSSPSSSLSPRAESLGSFERSPPPDVRAFSQSPPLGFLDR